MTYFPYKEKAEMAQQQQNTRKKRHRLQIKKEEKRKRKKHVWLSGRLHIERRLNEGPRLQRKHRDENEAKQNKLNARENTMASANETPGGYKFVPFVASQEG